jgi:hypothetical protein
MKQLPNVLLRMYRDPRADHQASRQGVLEQFIPQVLAASA